MSSALFETVKKVFSSENWAFAEVPGREVLRAGFEAKNTRVELHVQAFPELAAVSVVSESYFDSGGDAARRERLAELVMRNNQMLTVGNFEMDWDSGQVIFRATNLFPTQEGDSKIIRGLVHATISEMDRLAPLVSIVVRAEGPELAGIDIAGLIRESESPDASP